MTDIPLSQIKPNPFRDFELHPIDPQQVERLQASIAADGFWASVVARKVGRWYELAFGHHRVEAARGAGLKSAPIEVRDLSDWRMVRMLASENATQRGSTAAAALDAIAAISRVVAFECWRHDATDIAKIFAMSARPAETMWGRVRRESGIGEDCIISVAPRNAFTLAQVRIALGVLKDSGRMASIVADARAKAEAEIAAEQPKSKQQTATRPKPPAPEPPKRDITFDARCAKLFKLDSHLAEFRRIVTGETFQSYLPVAGQYEFGKSILDAIHENKPGKEITAVDIRSECWSRIETDLNMPKSDLRTAPERPFTQEIRDGLNFIRRAASDHRRGVALLLHAASRGERMEGKQAEQFDKLHASIEEGINRLKPFRDHHRIKLIKGGNDGV
jgi:hypothetical protein